MKKNTRDVTKDILPELSPEEMGFKIKAASYHTLRLELIDKRTWAVVTKSLEYSCVVITRESGIHRVLMLKGKPVMGYLKKIRKLLPQIMALPVVCYECGFEIIGEVQECPDNNPYCGVCFRENIFPCASPKCDEFASRGEDYCKYCKEE